MDFDKLKTELTTDPLGRGYAGMNDAAVATSLNTADRQVDPDTVPTMLILKGMVFSEYAALSADQKQYLGYIFSREFVDIRVGTQTRVALLAMFGAGTATRTNITALLANLVSRGTEIGVGYVRAGEVAMARTS